MTQRLRFLVLEAAAAFDLNDAKIFEILEIYHLPLAIEYFENNYDDQHAVLISVIECEDDLIEPKLIVNKVRTH
jgi:hypothetical protein